MLPDTVPLMIVPDGFSMAYGHSKSSIASASIWSTAVPVSSAAAGGYALCELRIAECSSGWTFVSSISFRMIVTTSGTMCDRTRAQLAPCACRRRCVGRASGRGYLEANFLLTLRVGALHTRTAVLCMLYAYKYNTRYTSKSATHSLKV